jgi:uncharacterized protein
VELTHTFTVPASVEQTWAAFEDIESVAGCFPGATVTSVDGDDFKGSCKVKLGPVSLVYNGSGTFVERDETSHKFVLEAKGKDKRGNGTAGATVTATFADAGSGSTTVRVLTDLAITGKPAQFGRGMIQDVSDALLQKFVTCLESKVGGDQTPDTGADIGAGAGAGAGAGSGNSSDSGAGMAADTGADTATAPTHVRPADVAATQTNVPPGATDESSADEGASRTSAASASPIRLPRPQDDALDLGATVLPIMVKAYWRQALAVLVGLFVLSRILRRRR